MDTMQAGGGLKHHFPDHFLILYYLSARPTCNLVSALLAGHLTDPRGSFHVPSRGSTATLHHVSTCMLDPESERTGLAAG